MKIYGAVVKRRHLLLLLSYLLFLFRFRSADFLTVTASCDHRVVDGAIGAKWLQTLKQFLEDPITMII